MPCRQMCEHYMQGLGHNVTPKSDSSMDYYRKLLKKRGHPHTQAVYKKHHKEAPEKKKKNTIGQGAVYHTPKQLFIYIFFDRYTHQNN